VRIVFLSPIPPIPSGTADYFSALVQEVADLVRPFDPVILVDPANYNSVSHSLYGIQVVDYQSYRVSESDKIFAFVANNSFHAYVSQFIRSTSNECLVVFFHDVQMAMIGLHLIATNSYGFSVADAEEVFGAEIPKNGEGFIERVQRGTLPDIMRYVLTGSHHVLARAQAIVTHSRYGFLKLRLEAGVGHEKPIYIMNFPGRTGLSRRSREKSPLTFRIGVFGYIAPHKRPNVVLEAYKHFLSELPLNDRLLTRLTFVGRLSDIRFDPRPRADDLKVGHLVDCILDANESTYDEELMRMDMLINLRYPSCGETSATLKDGTQAGIPIVTSAYQAMYEERCAVHAPLDDSEIQTLVEAMLNYYRLWKDWAKKQSQDEADLSSRDWRSAEPSRPAALFQRLIRQFEDGAVHS
jgi:glycosyltransferase involved in cell wall biosynthesis